MEYHLVSVHTCAIRFHSSVCLQQHGSDFLDSYSAYHYEANCITLYRWGRYSTGSRCEACNSEAQECRRNQHRPYFAKSIKNGVLRAYRGGRVSTSAQQPHAGTSATPQEGSSDVPTAALVKSACTTNWLAPCRSKWCTTT